MEEDEILKRNTDCVYYLASPFTCKKGNECEYRHSESARLNPRDCWYWLSGNCLNPTCAYRHPPLEGFAETSSDLVQLPLHNAAPTSKSNVPCYFYFNAICVKGDQCTFLHDILPVRKLPKTAPEATTANPMENKTSTGSDTGPASVEAPANANEGTSTELMKQFHSKEVIEQSAPGSVMEERSPSSESSLPEYEEPSLKLSDNLLPAVDYMNGRSHLSPDQSSEELVKDCVEREEWWESSPGFDVLVDDGSEQLAYEDDADYLVARERESERLRNHFLPYDFEGSAGYDPISYPDDGYLYDHGMYDSYDGLEDGYAPDCIQRVSEHSKERILEPMFHRKRKLMHREHQMDARDSVDLRDHLRNRRGVDVCQVPHNSRKRHSSRTRGSSRERPARRGMGQSLRGKSSSEVGKNLIGSAHSDREIALNDRYRQGWLEYSQSSRHARSRQGKRESRRHGKPPPVSSKFPRGLAEARPHTQAVTAGFTGPKTLAQIREEKSRSKADGNGFRNLRPRLSSGYSDDFQGPKPLTELLKDRRRPTSTGLEQEHRELTGSQPEKRISDSEKLYHETAEQHYREYDHDFVDEDDEEDDGLRKKLVGILY